VSINFGKSIHFLNRLTYYEMYAIIIIVITMKSSNEYAEKNTRKPSKTFLVFFFCYSHIFFIM